MSDKAKAGESRVWFFPDGVGPGRTKIYLGCHRLGDPTYNFGDMTRIECPSPDQYNEFVEEDSFQGSKERPTSNIMGRFDRTAKSTLLAAGRKRCRVDVHGLFGRCTNPQDYTQWDQAFIHRKGRLTSWNGENFGALASDEQNPTNKTAEFSSDDIYQILPIMFGEQCATEVVREIVAIVVCDAPECGDCDTPSDGCQKVFAVMLGTGATPGTLPSVVFSEDGGVTCDATDIDTLFSNEDPTDAACVRSDLLVISETGGAHLAPTADILDGIEVWVEQSDGLDMVGGNGPISVWSVDARHTWIGGANGYVYFSSNPRHGWTIQDPGVAATLDLLDVHAYDIKNVVAVGDLNTVVRTSNGGQTWEPIVGPALGEALNCVWMYDADTWLIGTSAGGYYRTTDAGQTWENIVDELPIAINEVIEILFYDDTVGFMTVTDGATHSLILRTTDGGTEWKVLPDGPGDIPDNNRINMLATCDPNIVWGGGLGANGVDGIIVKAA